MFTPLKPGVIFFEYNHLLIPGPQPCGQGNFYYLEPTGEPLPVGNIHFFSSPTIVGDELLCVNISLLLVTRK